MSDFMKICVTFSILKGQKGDAYQNGEEFCHEHNGYDVKWPLLSFAFCRTPLIFSFDLLSSDAYLYANYNQIVRLIKMIYIS